MINVKNNLQLTNKIENYIVFPEKFTSFYNPIVILEFVGRNLTDLNSCPGME